MEQALAIASQTALVTLKYFAENPNHLVAVLGGVSTALLGFPLCIDNMLKQARFDELKAARTQASLQTWKISLSLQQKHKLQMILQEKQWMLVI